MAPEKGSTELNNYEFSVSITKSRFDQWNYLFKKQRWFKCDFKCDNQLLNSYFILFLSQLFRVAVEVDV